jgi:hypothetical protein
LLGWFFNSPDSLSDLINTNLEFYVNETSIGFVDTTDLDLNGFGVVSSGFAPFGNEGTPTNYQFTNIGDASELTVTVADEFDPSNCNLWLSSGTTLCALQDTYLGFDQDRTDLNINVSGLGNLFYAYPFMFEGATQSTQFFFRIRITNVATNQSWGPTAYFPILIADINNQPQFWEMNNPSVVPNAWSAPAATPSITGDENGNGASFPEVLQDSAFLNSNQNTNPIFTVPLPAPTNDGGVNDNSNFRRTIQFKAIQSDTCDATGHEFLIKRGQQTRTAITFVYYQQTGTDMGNASTACTVNRVDSNFRTVFIQHSTDVQPAPTAADVIMQMYNIYATGDISDPTPAATGYYMYDYNPEDLPFQSWYMGRRGRVWREANQGGIAWDTLTDYDASAQFSAGTVWFNTGRLICESADADGSGPGFGGPNGFTDAGTGDTDDGIDWGNGTGNGGNNPFLGPR